MVGEHYTCPVFHPTLKDLQGSFEEYVTKIERRIAHVGLCKIVAPKGWCPRQKGYQDLELEINRPIRQHATGSRGVYRMLYIEQKPMSLQQDFKAQALDADNLPPARFSNIEDIERLFWKNVSLRPPLYGADIEGSLFDENLKGWNLRDLRTLLTSVLKDSGHTLPGVNTPYLYFGMWRSLFAWHTEDVDLYSVNYLHFGASKSWYCIPPAHRARFETMMKGLLPEMFRHCPEFLRHKELLVSPDTLRQYQIPFVKMTQNPGEFIINYPGAYHAGFNHGFNCAESVNFATKRWIPIGARAGVCCCEGDSVKINMKMFIHLVPKRLLPSALLEESESSDSESEEVGTSDGDTQQASMSTAASSGEGDEDDDEDLSQASSKTDIDAEVVAAPKRTAAPKRRRPASNSMPQHKRAQPGHARQCPSTSAPSPAQGRGRSMAPARGSLQSRAQPGQRPRKPRLTQPAAVASPQPSTPSPSRPSRPNAAQRYQEARVLLLPRKHVRSSAQPAASHGRSAGQPAAATAPRGRSMVRPRKALAVTRPQARAPNKTAPAAGLPSRPSVATTAELERAAMAAVAAVKAAVAVHGRTRRAACVFAGPSGATRSKTSGTKRAVLSHVRSGGVSKH